MKTLHLSMLRWWCLYACLHVLARALSLHYWLEAPLSTVDVLRAVVSDVAAAAWLAGVAALLGHVRPWLAQGWLVLWCCALAGNVEYIGEWQNHMDYADLSLLFEPVFLEGSVLTLRPMNLAALFFAIGVFLQRVLPVWPASMRASWAACVASLLVFAIPATAAMPWMYQHPLEANATNLFFRGQQGSMFSGSADEQAQQMLTALKKQDLSGVTFASSRKPMNVLMIFIESLSQDVIERGWMPYLQSLQSQGLHYTQFINNNIVTMRGVYASTCGEHTPFERYGHDKNVRHIRRSGRVCLPRILQKKGYQSAFIQAAPLEFQGKGGVMQEAGFNVVMGDGQMGDVERRSRWGIDDLGLFQKGLKQIKIFESSSTAPWFVTILGAGTHHPFSTPPEFMPEVADRKKRAFLFTDDALRQLLDELRSSGRLENTLLLITGDESRALRKAEATLGGRIIRNYGFMLVLTPEGNKAKVGEPFMQSDLPLSIVDYMQFPSHFSGRSLFRRYGTFRPLVFADYGQDAFRAVMKPDVLTSCNTVHWKCKEFPLGGEPLFLRGKAWDNARDIPSDVMRTLYDKQVFLWHNPEGAAAQ